jgi:hypothetical protein
VWTRLLALRLARDGQAGRDIIRAVKLESCRPCAANRARPIKPIASRNLLGPLGFLGSHIKAGFRDLIPLPATPPQKRRRRRRRRERRRRRRGREGGRGAPAMVHVSFYRNCKPAPEIPLLPPPLCSLLSVPVPLVLGLAAGGRRDLATNGGA